MLRDILFRTAFLPVFRAAFCAGLIFPSMPHAVTDITFFSVSDTHYGNMGGKADENRKAMIGYLNNLPGVNYPASVGGGLVDMPRGVVMPGDLIDRPDAGLWSEYIADYGVNGEGRLKFPVFDGIGNHDVWNYSTSKSSNLIKHAVIERNAQRIGITNYDAEHLHYSWDWDQVHFIHLNIFAGSQIGSSPQWDPFKSMEFLKADLEKYVGTSGRPVLLLQHFNVDAQQNYYQNSQKEAMIAILKKYNCIGLLHGHSHSKKFYTFDGLQIFDDGTVMNGDALVFRITDGKMFVVNRVGRAWGNLKYEKSISMGEPNTQLHKAARATESMGGGFTFNVDGVGRLYASNLKVMKVEITGLDGRQVRTMTVNLGEMNWDRYDDHGHLAPPGLYLVRIETAKGPVMGKVLLR